MVGSLLADRGGCQGMGSEESQAGYTEADNNHPEIRAECHENAGG